MENRNIYKGHRYVPKIMGEWDQEETYEGLSIVTFEGNSYTSKKRVPIGIDLSNEEYWVVSGNYNAQVENYRQDVTDVKDTIEHSSNQLIDMENKNPLYLTDFIGADKTGLTPSTQAFEDAVNKAINEKRKLIVPTGLFVIDRPLTFNFNAIDIIIEGESSTEGYPNSRLLWKGGSSTFFKGNSVRKIMFRDIEISGSVPPSMDTTQQGRIVAGSTGLEIEGSIEFDNVVMMGFDRLVNWNGGYYHFFRNSNFRYFNIGFDNVMAHNFNFHGCKIRSFQKLIEVAGGSGAVTFNQCVIEQITLQVVNCLSGTTPIINFTDSYIENYPGTDAAFGLEGNPTYTANNVTSGGGIVNFTGNNIVTSGLKRVIHTTADTKNIISIGNRIGTVGEGVKGSLEYYMFVNTNVKQVLASDMVNRGNLSQPSLYSAKYIPTSYGLQGTGSYLYDPFKEKKELLSFKRDLVLTNGWKKVVEESGNPKAILIDGVVHLYGYVNRINATSNVLAILSSEFTPTELTVLSTTSTRLSEYPSETFNVFISTNGSISIPATIDGNIILTGLSYPI